MPKFQEDKFNQVVTTHYAAALGVAPAAVPTDLITLLLSFFSNIFTSCFNNPTPTPAPASSADIAAQIKGANVVQKAIMRQRVIRHYLDHDKSRKDGIVASQAMFSAVDATSVNDLAQAIDDARTDASAIPEFDQI